MPESCAHCMMNRKWSTKRLPSRSATPAQVAHLEIQTELPTCAQGGATVSMRLERAMAWEGAG